METFKLELGGRTLSIEIGRVAKQAHGSCWVRYGDTVSMVAVCVDDRPREYRGFFPLTVDYREKTYAAGRIPGGFFKREGRPSEKEILSARLIDRPIRPLFPKEMHNEVQVAVTTLSSDQENDADILGLIGTSVALNISKIPFGDVLGAVRVGLINDQLVLNPTFSELDESDLNLIIAGSKNHILMVEGGCSEISEEQMLKALEFGHDHIKSICELIEQIKAQLGQPKLEITPPEMPEGLEDKVRELATAGIVAGNGMTGKVERAETISKTIDDTIAALEEEYGDYMVYIREFLEDIEATDLRKRIFETRKRMDGRELNDIREISSEVSVLPRTHGSALFTRGQTQALVTATLGTKLDEQRIDALEGNSFKNYMLHYNFPPYSVGEVRPIRGPGRREIGHGALAERAIQPVLPTDEAFPYTIRLVSEIMESNGSSSMATVCGGILALMDAGVPIKSPVAGIAMGLIMSEKDTLVLTDILGSEDHFGDMDFKVAGSKDGITAFQLDIKIGGLTIEIMREALERAREARLFIIDKMMETIAEPRADISEYAPRIITVKIKPDRIGEVIGPGGKMIRSIIEATGTTIDIEDDGTVHIGSVDGAAGERAKEMVLALVEEPEVDRVYQGTVKRVADFGAFVEILPNTDGLLHVSEIAYEHVRSVDDVMKVGDKFEVKVLSVDPDGKVRLSRKALLEKPEGWVERSGPPRDSRGRGDRDRRPSDRRDRRPNDRNRR
jgi:polyribonucleotide nucleotidyltransferase